MLRVRSAIILVMSLAGMALLADDGEAAQQAAKKKKKGNQPVTGVVSSVQKDTITVKVQAKKKAPAPGEEKKFTINDSTKFESLSGKKGATQARPATAADIKTGSRVRIEAKGNTVEKIGILTKKKKNENSEE